MKPRRLRNKRARPLANAWGAPESARQEPDSAHVSPIVGIGASAGGLEPCERLLRNLPRNTGMAFVIVQHLDPTHESRLTEILSHATTMAVFEVKDGICVEPNHVYIIPPNKIMFLKGRALHLEPRRNSETQHLPIDFFFGSLAAELKNRAIGIILSGTASDGAAGMKAIKAEGGITFAQDAGSAKYYGMPQSSIAAGAVDFVLSPEEIGASLARIIQHPYLKLPGEAEETALPAEGDSGQLLRLLKKSFGVDFRHYKTTTIQRRIRRRMAMRAIDGMEAYLHYVQKKPEELEALFRDMFIGVTGFFRDAGMFKALDKVVYPAMLKNRPPDTPIRIWVPGCSTGEEVYSIIISLLEYLSNRAASTSIQVFGTDANEDAVKKARTGRYGTEIISDVSASRLRRFFTKTDDGFQITKAVRDLCIFARHDIIRDAPFRSLDLLSCRNLLIYLNAAAHKKLMPLFHYTLKASCFLVLGSAETIGGYGELFAVKDRRYKIYQKRMGTSRPYFAFPNERPFESVAAAEAPLSAPASRSDFDLHRGAADQMILNQFGPPAVLVNEHMEILHFRGQTSPYLEPAQGAASLNLMKMLRKGLAAGLHSAFDQAAKTDVAAHKKGLRVDFDSQRKLVNISVVPVRAPGTRERTFLVLFAYQATGTTTREKGTPQEEKPSRQTGDSGRVARLDQELASTKAYLQSVIESQEAANEELRSLNEEIQSSNEELQSTSEELETANEELQSSNEELNTLNEELQNRNLELAQVSNDVVNLLHGLQLIVLMLSRDLRIRRFTPAAQKTLNLVSTDVNRPLGDVRLPVGIPDLERMILQVMETGAPQEFEVQDSARHWYLLQIRPYLTMEGKVEGSIIALYDVHESKLRGAQLAETNDRLQQELTRRQEAEEKFRIVVESAPDAVVLSDPRGKITLVNGQVERLFGYQRDELIGQPAELLVPERLRSQHIFLRTSNAANSQTQPTGTSLDSFGLRKDGSEFPVEINLSSLHTGGATLVCSIIRDVSQQRALAKEAQQAALLEERNRMAMDVHDTLAQGLTGIVLQLESAEEASYDGIEDVRKHIARARDLARESLEQARRSVLALAAPELEREDLQSSLRQLVKQMNPDSELGVEFILHGTPRPLGHEIKEGLLRIAQQSLTNALQHARARKIGVELAFGPRKVSLEVSDDGRGFSVSKRPAGHLGLRGMEHRAKELGGKLQLRSRAGKGTRVTVTVPLPDRPPAL
jgi:two-component system, chemotaxis family, CheB/CheR fusion protein